MASEVERPHILGNFRPSPTERLKAKRARDPRAEREGNSEAHLAALLKCPCVATLRVPAAEVHHLKAGTGERGMGIRSSDKWGVPLSRIPHEDVERAGSRNELAVFRQWGIEAPLDLAAALWAASPDVARMTNIILTWRTPPKLEPK